tara:strand:+ start:224 stop:832 length:609 start_codon:yes stop_codon:yes gene_type:complete
MEARITVLSLFLISNLAIGFMYFQWEIDQAAVLFVNRPAVPLLILSFGPIIQIAVLWMVRDFLNEIRPVDRLFPQLAIPVLDTKKLAYKWERMSAWIVLGLPIIGFSWAWHRFLTNGSVWETKTGTSVDRFYYVSPNTFFGDWDTHRYGDQLTDQAASFVPFWQPLIIMGFSSVAVVIVTLGTVLKVKKRSEVRRRIVFRPM